MKKALMNKTAWMRWMVGAALLLAAPLYAKDRGPGRGERDNAPREMHRMPQPERCGRGEDRPRAPREDRGRGDGWGYFLGACIQALTTPPPPPEPHGYWQEQEQRVWVEGYWQDGFDAYGRPIRNVAARLLADPHEPRVGSVSTETEERGGAFCLPPLFSH